MFNSVLSVFYIKVLLPGLLLYYTATPHHRRANDDDDYDDDDNNNNNFSIRPYDHNLEA